VHPTQHFTLRSTSLVGEEEGWEFTPVYGLQATEQDDYPEQVSAFEN